MIVNVPQIIVMEEFVNPVRMMNSVLVIFVLSRYALLALTRTHVHSLVTNVNLQSVFFLPLLLGWNGGYT
jgi:hypothetical protein